MEKEAVETLVRSAQKGDREAFKKLYEQFKSYVFRTAFGLVGRRMSAEDVTQQVFEKLYRNLADFDFDSRFSTWCYRITVNTCYDRLRKWQRRNKYHVTEEPADDDNPTKEKPAYDSPERRLDRKQIRKLITGKLQDLSLEIRTTFVLREYEQLPYAEIAEIMQCSEGTVASRLSRARSKLAEFLRAQGIDQSDISRL